MSNQAGSAGNQPNMMLLASRHRLFLVFLLFYSCVLIMFPMSLQAMESYAYAAAAEGYYNLASTFAVMNEAAHIPDFSHYHPNHPLPHLVASAMHRLTGLPALLLFRAMNFAGTIAFLCLHYALALRILGRPLNATMATALCAVTYAIWASALSGEVQMVSLALLMAGFYFLTRYFEAQPGSANGQLRLAAVFYVLAVAFHQASFFAGIPAVVAALTHSRTRQSLLLYGQVAAIVAGGWAFFYIILLVPMLHIESVQQYLDTLFVYRHILAREYGSGEWFALLAGAAARSVAFADFGISFFVALSVLATAAVGFRNMYCSPLARPVLILLAGLPVFQIGLQLAVRGRPEGINFWLFLMPCIAIAAFFRSSRNNDSPANAIYGLSLVVILALVNFHYFFLPNHRLQEQDTVFTEGVSLPQNLPLAIVVHEPVLTFVEGWSLGSRSGLRDQAWFFPCCGQRDFERKLAQWIGAHPEFLLLSDNTRAAERLLLQAGQLETEVLIRRKGNIAASTLPRSLYFVSHEGEHYSKELLLVRARHRAKTTKP